MWIDRRALFAIAAVSLLLNVFLGGAVLGRAFGGTHRAARPGPGGGQLVPPAHVQALPQEERQRFRAAMAPHRPAIRAARQAHREARRQIEADVAATTYDKTKVEADFEALRQSNRNIDEAVDGALIDALAELQPASRATLVNHEHADKSVAPPRP